MTTPTTTDLTILLGGAIGGLVMGLLGLGWGSITSRALLLAGAGLGDGCTTLHFSELLIDSGYRLLFAGRLKAPQNVKKGLIPWFTPIPTMLGSAATLGYLPPYAKPLATLLNLQLVVFLTINIFRDQRHGITYDISGEIRSDRTCPQLLSPPRLVALSFRLLLLAPLTMQYGVNICHITLLVIPALTSLYISRLVVRRLGLLSHGLAILILASNGVLSLLA
ncbi:MAG: hypothetical protein QXO86_01150 [Nitrososphaerota archaeon]